MLRKLMKHEFRATARIMGPLYLALLVLSICANGSIRLLNATQNKFLTIVGGLILTLFVIAVIGVCIMTLIVMINRFRTNLLGDEGYVMLTLPASVHEQVFSKIIVSTVWFFASAVAVGISAIIASFRIHYVGEILQWIENLLDQITSYYALNGMAFFVEFLILAILGCAACCLQFYAAMAVGHSFANHKALLSVAFFFAFQFVLQFLSISGLIGVDNLSIDWDVTAMQAVHSVMGLSIGVTLIVAAVFYIITTIMLKKHINLE